MGKVYITLTGTKHYFGDEFLEKDMKLILEKEPDNEFDKEAIKVLCEGIETMSAGRLYDKIGDSATVKVVFKTEKGVICKVAKKSLIDYI